MITPPLWLATNWKLAAGALIGATLCYPVASCQGRRDATTTASAKIIAASAKAREASAKAETAAVLADMARTTATAKEADELRGIIHETKSDAGVGPATSALLEQLRQRRSGGENPGS